MTDKDAEILFEKIVGLPFKRSVEAFKSKYEGNEAELQKLLEVSGQYNGTEPENLKIILNKFF